jgi:hypothetical protein
MFCLLVITGEPGSTMRTFTRAFWTRKQTEYFQQRTARRQALYHYIGGLQRYIPARWRSRGTHVSLLSRAVTPHKQRRINIDSLGTASGQSAHQLQRHRRAA